MIRNSKLISVCVDTYNAVDTVIETLESVKRQTYDNIELVITDDGSKDGTVDLCEKWIKENCGYFMGG